MTNGSVQIARMRMTLSRLEKNKRMERRKSPNLQNCNRVWGKGFATVGRTKECKIVSNHHFGSIPGVEVGESWPLRLQVSEAGVHRLHVAGIAGTGDIGCESLVLFGGYEDDVDNGDLTETVSLRIRKGQMLVINKRNQFELFKDINKYLKYLFFFQKYLQILIQDDHKS